MLLGVLLAVSLGVMAMAPSARKAGEKIKALVAANPEVKVPWEWDVDVGIQLAALINAVVLTGLKKVCLASLYLVTLLNQHRLGLLKG